MYLVITYDCKDEKVRRKVRSLLRKYSFTMLTYSVYLGRGSKGIAHRIASLMSKMLDEDDRATVMLLNNFEYEVLMEVTKRNISVRGEKNKVIVFYGEKPRINRSSNESIR